ncbi:hypothetical protein P0D88_50130 [Paraburkholderia sp. RL18-103-BIB-C]|jgi:hypothetical protein|uniref:hypothetical protein n=1 Tax=unclassified Paraburkholderia TaxID=2615204 RepID=UPI0038B7E790
MGAWITARYGRKVRLKIGDVEVEARSIEEVDQLLQRARAFKTAQTEANDEA